jgi:uncharacterized membrane protein
VGSRVKQPTAEQEPPVPAGAATAGTWLAVAAGLGVILSGYLLYIAVTDARAFCPTGSGCDAVLTSRYARIFGIPIALAGLVFYWTLLGAAMWPMDQARRARFLIPLAAAGAAATATLVMVQFGVIRALCSLCAGSALLTIAALILALRSVGRPTAAVAGGAVGAAIVTIVVMAGAYALDVPPPRAPADRRAYATELARHLTLSGAKFYGAYWCSHCAEQKDMFGSAAALLPYVECDPRPPGAQPDTCKAKNIRGYPTWEINGQRREGVLFFSELAELSGFRAPPR